MTHLVSSVSQVIENLRSYNDGAEKVADLMPYNRSWYALRAGRGWLLGPSKYVGYQHMTPDRYLGSLYSVERRGRVDRDENSGAVLDGRVSEGVLSRWSELVEKGHPEYDDLHTALNELCARYGKKPNTLARISIVRSDAEATTAPSTDDLVALLAAVFRALTPAQKSAFRKLVA